MKTLDTALTREALALCKRFGERELIQTKLQVVWNSRMSSTAGRAFWPSCIIELNPLLRDISDSEVKRTLRHELAHLLTNARYGTRVRPHGMEWKLFCVELGIPGEPATHRLALPRRTLKKQYFYECPECGSEMGSVRKLKRKAACKACCTQWNGGRFSKKYVLRQIEKED